MATRDPHACTAVPYCTRTARYLIDASGPYLTGRAVRGTPQPVHLRACEQHLVDAQRRIAGRQTRTITLIDHPQESLFDL